MPSPRGYCLRLGSPIAYGGRLFVPLIGILSIFQEHGGFGLCMPVALLIGDAGKWFFISLDPDITQECLRDPELLAVVETRTD